MKKHPNSIVFRFAAILCLLTGLVASAAVDRYVIKDHAGGDGEYLGWGTAAPDIQAAIDAADADDTIWVTNGVYDVGQRTYSSHVLSNRVVIDKAITLRAVSTNAADTQIVGAWDPDDPAGTGLGLGPAAVRCVYMIADSALIGFTLTNGATINEYGNVSGSGRTRSPDNRGGGLFVSGSGIVVSNCVIVTNTSGFYGGGISTDWNSDYVVTFQDCRIVDNRQESSFGGGAWVDGDIAFHRCLFSGNVAPHSGGGAYYGSYYDCTFSGNEAGAGNGGAVSQGTLSNCTVVANTAGGEGGGVFGSVLYDCTVRGNGSADAGAGASGSTLYRCTLAGNSAAADFGGGAYDCDLYNCVLTNNIAKWGGAAREGSLYNCYIVGNESLRQGGATYRSTLYNCTVVGNDSTSSSYGGGGGMYGGMAVNSIVYFNDTAASGPNYAGTVVYTNSLTYPAQAGWAAGNLTNAPVFLASGSGYGLDHQPGDYRLNSGSPGLNAGMEFAWMSTPEFEGDIRYLDLDGNPRIDKAHGIVDMGAYERTVAYGTLLLVY